MAFQKRPINTTGPSYKSRSKPLSSQQTKNWYPQLTEAGKDNYVLLPFPGLKFIGSVAGNDRGFHRMDEVLFQVKGTSLYSIDNIGNHILIGKIAGTGRCIMADDGVNLFIVTDLKVWHYDGITITEVDDTNITGAISVDFINNVFLYTKPDFTTVSNVGDGSTASGLNKIGEEIDPDKMVRDFVFDEIIYRCGVRTIVAWYHSGVGSPPIERLSGRSFNIGLLAINSIVASSDSFYWLGSDRSIYRSQSGNKEVISTDAIANEISKYSRVDDAVGNYVKFEGQEFYVLTFPSENKTFINSVLLGKNGWFEISSGINGAKWQGSSIIDCYDKQIVADEANGNVYELDLNTFTNNNETLHRVRITQTIDARILGGDVGDSLTMSSLIINMETSVGVIEGQGDNPRIMIEASYDGGRTFSSGTWARAGRLGEFVLKVKWDNMKTFYSAMFRISTSDPVNYSIYSASITVKLAGR